MAIAVAILAAVLWLDQPLPEKRPLLDCGNTTIIINGQSLLGGDISET